MTKKMPLTLYDFECARRAASAEEMLPLTWSRGRDRYDNEPVQESGDLRAFVVSVGRHRARDKARSGYVCAALSGKRSTVNAASRSWLALDVDSIEADALPAWRMFLAGTFRGFGWPTASSTPEAPRERVIVTLSRPVTRREGIYVGEYLTQNVRRIFGERVRLDPCTFRAEQPCFLPIFGVRMFFLTSEEPLRVDGITPLMPPAPPPMPEPTEAERAMLEGRFGWLLDALTRSGLLQQRLAGAGGFSLLCPWQAAHTTEAEGADTSTALMLPAAINRWRGAFVCLHAHCHGRRRLHDLIDLMRRFEREMSHESA